MKLKSVLKLFTGSFGPPTPPPPPQLPAPVKEHRIRKKAPTRDRLEAIETAFKPYEPLPGVRGANAVAMDSIPGLLPYIGQNFGYLSSFIEDGLNFKGYQTLQMMMLRAEFIKPVMITAREATREWIKFRSKQVKPGESEPQAVADKISQLEAEFRRLNVRKHVFQQQYDALAYGIGHLWFEVNKESLDSSAQKTPVVVGPNGIKKGTLDRLVNINPTWTNPNIYNSDNPLRDDFYKPQTWWVQGTEVHASRIMSAVPFPVGDLLKPAFNFGGLALPQMMEAYVHNFLRTRQNVSDLVNNFATKILLTDMMGNMQTPLANGMASPMAYSDINVDGIIERAELMSALQNNNSVLVADKNSEDFKIAAVPLSGLDALQSQSMEGMAWLPGIPIVKYFGDQPQGLNASSEGNIRSWYDDISAYQEANMEPTVTKIFHLAQLNIWGEIDETLEYEFVHLGQLSEKEAAEVEKIKADTDALYIQEGVVDPNEARERLAADPHSNYSGVDLTGDAPGLPDPPDIDPEEAAPSPKSLMENAE